VRVAVFRRGAVDGDWSSTSGGGKGGWSARVRKREGRMKRKSENNREEEKKRVKNWVFS
jgi:hypothetical protein